MNTIRIKLNDTDDVAVIRPGSGLSAQAKPVIAELIESDDLQNASVIIDVSGVTKVDSSGLGDLVESYKAVKKRGGHFVLASTPPWLQRILEISNVNRFLKSYESVAEAISDLQKQAGSSDAAQA